LQILHLADVHLDRPFVRADRRQGDRDRARVCETFIRALEPARTGQVNAVTIGGDLWEDEHVSADTRRFVAGELGKLKCPVLIVAGNHDPLLPGGNYERTAWPENVHVFKSAGLSEQRLDDEISVWGISWSGGALEPSFLVPGAAPGNGRTHLLLLHGTATPLATVYDDPTYCPFEPARISEAGFAYCFAGHIHAAKQTAELVYPGSPEPLGWGEMGRHCLALATIEDGGVQVELRDVNQHRYEERAVDCRGAEHHGEIAERLRAALIDENRDVVHLRVLLQGEVAADCEIAGEELAEQCGEGYAELIVVDETRPAYDLDALAQQPTARGYFVRRMRDQLAATSDEAEVQHLELALIAGLRALDGRGDVVDVA